MRHRHAVAALAAALALSASAPARADVHGEAVRVFEEGRKIRERDPDKALRIFQASIALEPSVGAYYNIANIHEQQGRSREAVDTYRKSAALAKERHDDRDKDAEDAIRKILEAHSYVVVKVDEAVASTPGLRVLLDNVVVPPEQYNGEVFRTAQSHEVLVTATGHKERRVTVQNRQSFVVALGEIATAAAPPPPPPPPPEQPPSSGWGWQKWTGLGGAVVGLGVVGVGVALHLDHLKRLDAIKGGAAPTCATPCTIQQQMDRDAKIKEINVDTTAENSRAKGILPIPYAIGSALVIGGAVLFFTAPSSSANSGATSAARVRVLPHIGTTEGGVNVLGTF